jgi:hypothetical protein
MSTDRIVPHDARPNFAGLADKELADRALHIFVTTYGCDVETAVSRALAERRAEQQDRAKPSAKAA